MSGSPAVDFATALDRAQRWSPFLAMIMEREPEVVAALRAGRIDLTVSAATGDMPIGRRLRNRRRALALNVAVGDLAGLLDLTEVTRALSRFADEALAEAIRAAIQERYPDAEPRGFAAIALGKQGSNELNYSSDIDPILIYDPDVLPRRAREEPEEAAVRIARRVVEILSARDGDGYVLRVDLRLRPSPEVTPIAVPVNGAIAYYEGQALAWERAAFIRARAAAGDLELGGRFLDAVRPFVWRRALDFGAVREITAMSARIRDHYVSGQAFGPGFDLKRGRGGIREIEFFAQIHQLIHGGRDPSLRAPATRDALSALAGAGRIGTIDADLLTHAYVLLRTIEHRVQMIDDRQTHLLPAGEALEGVARLHGLGAGTELLDLLRSPTEDVGRIFDALSDGDREGLPRNPADALVVAGFADPEFAVQRIAAWRAGTYPALRSPAARDALEAVLPTLIQALGSGPAPADALRRMDAVLERMSSAINIFRLLEARPGLADLLARILAHAAPLADELARRPALLDGLIDASAMDDPGDVPALVAIMSGGELTDYGSRLDHVRRVVGEVRFALGAQLVAGAADPLAVAAGYARLAEAAVQALAAASVAEFENVHGRVPGGELVVLALGRLGGGALTHASDLDLIYLFTGEWSSESNGAKPLGATLYFNRLATRTTSALSVATAAGPLYAVDTRLRPSGAQGPLAVSLDSFARYQREEAWTWEHLALTRARPVYGSDGARRAVTDTIHAVLSGDRPQRDILAEARTMRADMANHKPAAGPLDVKLLPGGLVDLEFATHVRQLTHGVALHPHLGTAIDALVRQHLAPPAMLAAHDLLTRMLVTMRLLAPDGLPPAEPTRALIAQLLGVRDWDAVVAGLNAARQDVGDWWKEVV